MVFISNLKKFALALGLAIGFFACYILVGPQLAILYALLWLDRVVIGYARIAYEFGIELITSCMIIVGIVYGPSFAFLFGFFVYPIVDSFRWVVATPFTPEWPPVIPSPDSFVAGAVGFIAGYLTLTFETIPFFVVVFACLIARIPLCVAKDTIFYGTPFKPAYLFAIPFTFIVVNVLKSMVA